MIHTRALSDVCCQFSDEMPLLSGGVKLLLMLGYSTSLRPPFATPLNTYVPATCGGLRRIELVDWLYNEKDRMIMRLLFTSLVLVVLLAGLAGSVVAQENSNFEPVDCWFGAVGENVDCGYVIVPEDHFDPTNTNTIKLAVAVFRSTSAERQSDPVMLLSGGPGQKLLDSEAGMVAQVYQPFYGENRDFIVFDQRGAGMSQPALECPEWEEALLDGFMEADPNVSLEDQYHAALACAERLQSEGYPLDVFTTQQNAADINAIRVALGYEQVNLVGVSYGSLLAQAAMRDYPEGIRSVVIDSVMPLDASLTVDVATTSSESLLKLVDACAADAVCNATYPDLKMVLFDMIDRLNAEPVELTLTNPATGENVPMLLTGDTAVGNLTVFLYQAPLLPLLPKAIADVAVGDYTLMTQLSSSTLASYKNISRGMMFSVLCADDLIGRTPEDLIEVYAALPRQLQGATDIENVIEYSFFGICRQWPIPQSDPSVKNLVTETDIPALVLGGEYDPVTPSRYAQYVAENMSGAYFYEFPAIGHDANGSSPCAQQVTASFINNPTVEPDASCIAEMPDLTFGPTAITLVPFTNEQFAISGVIPDGWSEIAPGVYAESVMSRSAIVQQAMPGEDANVMISLLQQQLGLENFPASTGTREANGLTWELYELEMQGQPARVAITAGDGQIYLIMLVGAPDEIEQYTEELFLPAVDALIPAQ